MTNRLWWGYEHAGQIHCFEYHPAKEQYEKINEAEKLSYFVVYPFPENTKEDAFIAISKIIKERHPI